MKNKSRKGDRQKNRQTHIATYRLNQGSGAAEGDLIAREGDTQTIRPIDITTYRLKQPRGQFSENCKGRGHTDKQIYKHLTLSESAYGPIGLL